MCAIEKHAKARGNRWTRGRENEENVPNRTIQMTKKKVRMRFNANHTIAHSKHRSHRIKFHNTQQIAISTKNRTLPTWNANKRKETAIADLSYTNNLSMEQRFELELHLNGEKNCLYLYTRTISFDWWQFQFVCERMRVCACIWAWDIQYMHTNDCTYVCFLYVEFTVSIRLCR